jgi:hypothetical protein
VHLAPAVLLVELLPALVLALRGCHVQGLAVQHVAVHLSRRLGRLLRGREAHEAEALALARRVHHHTRLSKEEKQC